MINVTTYARRVAVPRYIAKELKATRTWKDEDGKFQRVPPKGESSLVINWGCTDIPWLGNTPVMNLPDAVAEACNKFTTFELLSREGIPVVKYTKDQKEAQKWLDGGTSVFGRAKLEAHGGDGIVLAVAGKDRTVAPGLSLYTKHFRCVAELRVHVFDGKVIDVTQKRRQLEGERDPLGYYIRTHNRGWIFAREGIQRVPQVEKGCIDAMKLIGLDFGAVDVRVNSKGDFRILEINSAPGMEGTTLEAYTAAFKEYVKKFGAK